MRKLLSFFRSMKCGMLLLALILLLSLPGSLIPQGNAPAWYVEHYTRFHQAIFLLGLDHIFSTWYFAALVALLCVNLTLCSLTRLGKVRRQAAGQAAAAARQNVQVALPPDRREALSAHLRAARYRRSEAEGVQVWMKNRLGVYGSFLTHLGILLVFVVGGAVLCCSDVQDYSILPDEALTLSDGTRITVDDFQIEDESGRLDYASHLTITAPDGAVDGHAELRVNHPHSFRGRKYYQQTYGTCGSISVRDGSGAEDTFTLTEVCFLSADGVTGLWYEALYPGYVVDESGNYTLIASTSGAYRDPIYQVLVCGEEGRTPVLALPGESVTVGELTFTFRDPVSYPGIRVKTLPAGATALLYLSFAVLLLGLYLCFFHVPAVIALREEGYAVVRGGGVGLELELASVLGADYVPHAGAAVAGPPPARTEEETSDE